jgi:hypothetical protein
MITVHPERICAEVLAKVGTVLAVGERADEIFARFAEATRTVLPTAPPLAPGQCLFWSRAAPDAVVVFTPSPPRAERRRHVRKYAAGELGEDKSFYFRGPGDRLNLRARNLHTFVEMASGVDDETWRHHLARGDYSRWFRDAIKDEDLATEAEQIEGDPALEPSDSRRRIREAIERRYTAPA